MKVVNHQSIWLIGGFTTTVWDDNSNISHLAAKTQLVAPLEMEPLAQSVGPAEQAVSPRWSPSAASPSSPSRVPLDLNAADPNPPLG